MGSAALRFPQAVGQLLRDRRKELGLTLADVSDQLAEKGERFPTSTLARVEKGQLDPGVRRLYLLLQLYQLPPHLVSDLIELESLAAKPPQVVGRTLQELSEKGHEHFRRGDIAAALAYLFAVRQYVPDSEDGRLMRQTTTFNFASAARDLGKANLARQIIDDLLCEPPDPSIEPRILVLASSLWRAKGSLRVAMALIGAAEEALHEVGRDDLLGLVLHQKAKLLIEANRLPEAERCLSRALRLYRSAGDSYNEARALMLRAALKEKQGKLDEALRAARRVVRESEAHDLGRVRTVARIELGGLLLKAEKPTEAIRCLATSLGEAAELQDHYAQFLAHYHLWKVYESTGDQARATLELRLADQFLSHVDTRTPETEEVRREREKHRRR